MTSHDVTGSGNLSCREFHGHSNEPRLTAGSLTFIALREFFSLYREVAGVILYPATFRRALRARRSSHPMPTVYNISKVGWKPNQLRIWAYLNHRQDIFWSVETWPSWAQQMIVLEHKGDSQVFNLGVFLLLNGLNEETTVKWITARDFKDGQFVEGFYSQKEWNDIDRFLQRWRGGLLPLQGKRVYDIASGRPLDAGDYKASNPDTRAEQEFGNRITQVLRLGTPEDMAEFRAKEAARDQERGRSDDWIE